MKIGKVDWSQTAESTKGHAKEFGLHPMDNGKPFTVSELEKEHVLNQWARQYNLLEHRYLQHVFVLYSYTSGPSVYFPYLDVAFKVSQHSGCCPFLKQPLYVIFPASVPFPPPAPKRSCPALSSALLTQ